MGQSAVDPGATQAAVVVPCRDRQLLRDVAAFRGEQGELVADRELCDECVYRGQLHTRFSASIREYGGLLVVPALGFEEL